MLSLTPSAAEMITRLQAQADLPEGGLRIAEEGPSPGLHMSVEPQAAVDDVILLQHDVAVFLDPVAAQRLTEETLDARSNETGTAFYLKP